MSSVNNFNQNSRIKFGKIKSENVYNKDIILAIARNRYVKITIFFIIPLAVIYVLLFRWDDFENSCHIRIPFSIVEWNSLDIKKGINLLKKESPADYRELCDNVQIIRPDLACGGFGGGCFYSDAPHEINVSTIFRKKESHAETTAAIIAHEVCHLLQRKESRSLSEDECYQDYCRILKILNVRRSYDSRCDNGAYVGSR